MAKSSSLVSARGHLRLGPPLHPSIQLQATITTADLAADGVIQVRVINPEPNNGVSNALSFTVTGSASPPHVRLYLPVVIK